MILVMDASSLIVLARVGRLDLLRVLADRVLVSPRVYEEVAGKPGLPGAAAVIDATWIEQIPTTVADPELVRSLARDHQIALGEAETIAIASTCSGAVAVVDEKRARKVAKLLGCGTTGTLQLLVSAKKRGLVPAVAPLIDALAAIGFHMGNDLRHRVLVAAGEAG